MSPDVMQGPEPALLMTVHVLIIEDTQNYDAWATVYLDEDDAKTEKYMMLEQWWADYEDGDLPQLAAPESGTDWEKVADELGERGKYVRIDSQPLYVDVPKEDLPAWVAANILT